MLLWLTLAPLASAQSPSALATPTVTIDRAEAVRADWQAALPPVDGWTPVELIDFWDSRWPHHDGVVWYRLHWNQASVDTPVGLLLHYVCLADAVYVNGTLVHRDPKLVEPLSRSWIRPQYFLLDKPLLRAGENTVLVRVSGLATYQPGFGTVTVGAPASVQQRYRSEVFWRYDVQIFALAVSLIFGGLFLLLWLLRRKDVSYGWYALSALLSAAYDYNFVAANTWPFPSTDAFEAFNSALYFAAAGAFAVFLLRYCERRLPRTERMLIGLNGLIMGWSLLTPTSAGPWRELVIAGGGLIYYRAILAFVWQAVRSKRADQRVLAACLLLPMLISVHDFLLYYSVIRSDHYLLAITAPLTLVGMGFALAWRFARAMHRAEGFNIELKQEVAAATALLRNTLQREHALALANIRIGERLHLVRDLHDGFGGSLVGAIAALENPQQTSKPLHALDILKELRDDLRLVIDTTTHEQDTDLTGLLAPLRHRWSQRLEVAGIEANWQFDELDGLQLGPARSLDLLRSLQEALTNVLKHSGARHVTLAALRLPAHLSIEVRDDGNGFDPGAISEKSRGAGLASLRARVARLGGELTLHTKPGNGVTLWIVAPL